MGLKFFEDESNHPSKDSVFNMYEGIEYPKGMETHEQRAAFYVEAVEVFDMISALDEVELFVEEFMPRIKYLGNYKYMAFEKMIAEKKINYFDSCPY